MNTRVGRLVMIALLLAVEPAAAQPGDDLKSLRQEVEALKRGQSTIQKEIQEIKELLRARGAAPAARPPAPTLPETIALDLAGAPARGAATARVTLVEYTDYQCPFCGRYARETAPKIDDEYVKSGKLRYVVRDLPLESIHPNAFKAAEASHCAAEQGKYWELHDRLFANQQALDRPNLSAHARGVGLDVAMFDRCVDGGKFAERVRRDLAEAQRLGIPATPTFLVGVYEGGQLKGTRMVPGAQPYATIKAVIDEVLARAK